MEKSILHQIMSLKQREEYIIELGKQNPIIELKKTSIRNLKDMGITNQVLFTRKLKKQMELTSKL